MLPRKGYFLWEKQHRCSSAMSNRFLNFENRYQAKSDTNLSKLGMLYTKKMKQIKDIKIAIIFSSYRPEVTDNLLKNCIDTLYEKELTKKQIDIIKVPGALEIPLVSKKLAQKKIYDAIIVFGAVYKGKTYHFEQVANECVRGCMNVSYDYEIPVIFEVLCVYDQKDAIERAKGTEDNRGIEGALTALRMIELLPKL